jgi:hypothetical protein
MIKSLLFFNKIGGLNFISPIFKFISPIWAIISPIFILFRQTLGLFRQTPKTSAKQKKPAAPTQATSFASYFFIHPIPIPPSPICVPITGPKYDRFLLYFNKFGS